MVRRPMTGNYPRSKIFLEKYNIMMILAKIREES
jgi:hypothetical protein